MKNLTKTKIYIYFVIPIFLGIAFWGCSDVNSIMGSSGKQHFSANDPQENGRIQIRIFKGNNSGYYFHVLNETNDTNVNDFHVQFRDTTVQIINISTWPSGWIVDNATTNQNKGKVGVKTDPNNPNCDPVRPNKKGRPLWIDVRFGTSGDRQFNWQATQDGAVVQSGTDVLPQ